MGLFDRIKKAFTGKDDSKDEKLEEKVPEAEKEPDQNVESGKTSDDSDKTEETPKETKESTPEVKTELDLESEPKSEPELETKEVEKEPEEVQPKQVEPQIETSEIKEPVESKESEPEETQTETTTTSEDVEVEKETTSENIKVNEEVKSEELEESEEAESETEKEPEEEAKDDVKEYDEGLKKSRNSFSARFNRFLANFRSVDEDFFDDLEELLIESDVGYETAMRISDELREEVKLENAKKRSDVSNVIVKKLVDMYGEEGKDEDNTLKFSTDKTPTVFLFVGVNGAGKTTTIGKLAHRYQQEGKKVLLAAGDTFRAGAIEQLQEWGKRVNVPVQASKAHTDPASVVYDAVQRAVDEDFDILLVDTAGRLQNKEGLMRELEKIKRVITRELPDAPQEVLLVLDGSTGQNALSQAKQFNETTAVSGIVLTKLDGSSQGGIVLAIRNELHIPVKLVGLGEQMNDLRDFDPEKFIYGLFKELIVGASNK
ncbi:Signal recognition particle-docking protein FtsY [Companilactobacillus paralimentarius DSM 13238 = JCM 10415]|uniref:Signal recognition particle receptor FtsY n=1 Tax=Companilactobacillus paralimentarius DSM 13238 = JCM 10415 TaxID=1122151 RepID=A0A0R1PGM3_9LACO|nr:signal recognition particle-docking protein FtsY [Companilactobacillus paralimentarius]KRL31247.1 Signal recognition particle-docking protein FtsY [Companilactobacillus paralimentarius DSM 13238 = JCM 10415]